MSKLVTGMRKRFFVALTILLLCICGIDVRADEVETYRTYDVVVAIDVSGSMKQTDSERIAFETIELLLKLCGSNDRFGVVAFNDTVVYNSGLISTGDSQAKQDLLNQLSQLSYSGETDNGIGMREAVSLLISDTEKDTGKMLIYLADGVTDLAKSSTGRTPEDSAVDMQWGAQQAVEHQIPVFTFGFTGSFGQDMDELTAISARTGGTYNACAGPLQMMNQVSSIFITNRAGTILPQDTMTVPAELGSSTLTIGKEEGKDIIILCQTSRKLTDFEVLMKKNSYELENTGHCYIIKINEAVCEDISFVYKGEEGGTGIITIAEWEHPKPVEIPVYKPAVRHVEAVQTVPVKASFWECYQAQITVGIVAAILLLTVLICGIIIHAFFGKKHQRKDETELKGYLHAEFIDLKSRNDIPAITWNLSDYPQEGVTLKELFEGVGIKEDLPELDRICLYPSVPEQILLVHCTGGGIFIDDRNISANVPAKVRSGETIYVAFPENASEFSMKYEARDITKKEEF